MVTMDDDDDDADDDADDEAWRLAAWAYGDKRGEDTEAEEGPAW